MKEVYPKIRPKKFRDQAWRMEQQRGWARVEHLRLLETMGTITDDERGELARWLKRLI